MQEMIIEFGGWILAGIAGAIEIYRKIPTKKREKALDTLKEALADGNISKEEVYDIVETFTIVYGGDEE